MGDTLARAGGPLEFEVKVKTSEPLRVFVIKNALLMDMFEVEEASDGWQTLKFTDTPDAAGYYRIELHRVHHNPQYRGIRWRDWETVQAYSNPIWVK
jgi:hypothetical protein